jgi:hypothetical protein
MLGELSGLEQATKIRMIKGLVDAVPIPNKFA